MGMQERQIRDRHELAQQAAREAGMAALGYFNNRESLVVETKGDPQDVVSIADRDVESLIRKQIAEVFPEDGFLGEETGLATGTSGYTWVVDPIDGTSPFVNGMPNWCVSIAVLHEKLPVVGVICVPCHNEIYSAATGQGATLNGKPLVLDGKKTMRNAVTGIGANHHVTPASVGTEPRDVLLYEALFFCLHGLSARLRRVVPADRVEASPHFAGLAVTAATELGRQHLDAFDASQHRLERAKAYLPHVDSIKDMSGCLVDILLSGAGSIVPDPRETSTWEANVAIEVGLRGVVRAIATTTFRSETEQLIKRYARRFDCVRFDSNERQ